ncbi:hypothetical protein ACO0KY_19490 [Undibacterium sp. Dicai25W]|uniref:hypothetical protein n=1 Tax=Undibacterium sp. Dicai25W TaxID=3413034 RepID=UPI003BEF659A
MKNNQEIENPLYAMAFLLIVMFIISIKPMFLYATDKQAYYKYELENLEQVEQYKIEQFRSNGLSIDAYTSSMRMITREKLEINSQLNKNKNI